MRSDEIVLSLEKPQPGSEVIGESPLVASLRLCASDFIPGLLNLTPTESIDTWVKPGLRYDAGVLIPGCPLMVSLGDEATKVTGRVAPEGITVQATGLGEVFIAADGRLLTWRPADDAARQRPELILGPGLVLALALQGVFCLHASAVLGPAGAVLFAGPSGAGKSTLAARLSGRHGFQRLTDDIAPFTAEGSGCFVLPGFPQLKLPPEGQHPVDAPASYRIARLYLLTECDPDAPVREEETSPSVAALSVCGQTVASRLFPERLMGELLRVSAAFVEESQVRLLHYPKRPGSIADVARIVSEP